MSREKDRIRKKLENNPIAECNKIQNRFCPELFSMFGRVKDPRNQSYIDYSSRVMLGTMYYKSIAGISSMQERTRTFNDERICRNLYTFMGEEVKDYMPHGVTENEFLERLNPRELEDIQQNIVYSMIRRKTFDNAKMLKKCQVIVDATELDEGYQKKNEHYLSRCYNRGSDNEYVKYHRSILEAKIYFGENLVLKKAEDKIFTAEEIEMIQALVRKRMTEKQYHGYFINGYAILFSIETGMRVGEICSLKWNDVYDNYIQIHSQQLKSKSAPNNTGISKPKGTLAPKTTTYYYADWTKDEKGISSGGRKFPLTNNIRLLLSELKSVQNELGIQSEFVFCNLDGEWIKTDAYLTCLRRLCANLNLPVTNNHAFRMSLNSNVFIPLGIPATERASMLGHSVETNLKYYSFERKDSIDDICSLLDRQNQEVSPESNQNVISFPKTKTPEAL